MMGRCSACPYERAVAHVFKHHRVCEAFAALYQCDPVAALVDPAVVYAAAHPAEPAPVLEAPSEPKPKNRPVRAGRRPAPPLAPPAPLRVSGPVTVEYWAWQPTMLEELQAGQKV
jgi:hypothetical protein